MPRRSQRHLSTGREFRQQLQRVVDALVEEFSPTHIYLFGSMVEGTARPESSVDVLIITPEVENSRFFARIKRAIRVASDIHNIAPLVYTPDEVELLVQQGDGFMTDILEDGKLLYEKKSGR